MKTKIKLEFEVEGFQEIEELISLVQAQVSHKWSVWDKRSTDNQKTLMELIHNNPNELPQNVENYFEDKSEMTLFMLRTKDLYWDYVKSLDSLITLQKAYDKSIYDRFEPFEENHYGLHWTY